MPTARELLEQADALMRRNRAAGAATAEDLPAAARLLATSPVVPVTTSPALPHTIGPSTQSFGPTTTAPTLGPMTISPRSIQREPIAPSIARTSLPVDPTDSPFIVPAAERKPDAVEGESADIPLLTDAVPDFAEDVPVLTEVIEEIEVDASAPVSVSSAVPLEPPVDIPVEVPIEPPAGKDPLGLDQPAPGYEPTPETLWAAKRAAAVYDAPVIPEPIVADRVAPEPIVPEPIDETTAGYEADSIAHALAEDGEPDGAGEETPPAEAPVDAASAAAAAVGVMALGEAQKREVAEEIRMQVLQRIDIFTDTGLRDQLGERLKPLVDKASAELVEAINQHVGELLRAYVAEAIEREIESWRNRQA